jgi:hypothetical protein
LNNEMQLKELETEIQKMRKIIETDAEIIALHEKIIKVSDSQLKNGVITTSEYIVEVTNLFEAKTNEKIHQTQLELTKVNYQINNGIN